MVRPSILVTGGCGFVGRPLTRHLLAAGYDVVVVDDLSKGSPDAVSAGPHGSAALVVGSILDDRLLSEVLTDAQPVAVIHLAALHFIPDCEREPSRCVQINVTGTHNVLRCAAAMPTAPAFILASTAAVYAPSLTAHSESDEVQPMDIYGLSKLWCEHLVGLFHVQHRMSALVARLFNVYGPGETSPHLIPSLIERAARCPGRIPAGDMSTRRDYVYVEDVARALTAMVPVCRNSMALTACNVGSGEDRSGDEVVDALGRAMGTNLGIVRDADHIRTVDRPRLLANIGRARELLGWTPTTRFEDGLAQAVRAPYARHPVRDLEGR
jgi:UDP-glucose 4-epimerase